MVKKKNEAIGEKDDGAFLSEGGAYEKVKRAHDHLGQAVEALKEAGWGREADLATVLSDDLHGRMLFCCVKSMASEAGPGSIIAARTARRYADIVEQNLTIHKEVHQRLDAEHERLKAAAA